ncbi:MAG: hypothetical protein ACHQDF_00405 [Chitinophagales bacterium]
MKNSSQRKISFLVALFGWGIFMSARAQVSAKPVLTRSFSDLYFPGEMLKNKTPDLTAGSGFYPLPGDNGLFRPLPEGIDPEPRSIQNQQPGRYPVYPDQPPAYSSETFISMSPIVPANIYYCQSGFFCKKEWELEKTTHIPFRFRLGSLDYCNVLEGKQRPAPF